MKIYILEGHWGLDMSEVIGVYSSREKANEVIGLIAPRGIYEELCILEADIDKPLFGARWGG